MPLTQALAEDVKSALQGGEKLKKSLQIGKKGSGFSGAVKHTGELTTDACTLAYGSRILCLVFKLELVVLIILLGSPPKSIHTII